MKLLILLVLSSAAAQQVIWLTGVSDRMVYNSRKSTNMAFHHKSALHVTYKFMVLQSLAVFCSPLQDQSIQYAGIWSQYNSASPVTSPNMRGRLVTVQWDHVRTCWTIEQEIWTIWQVESDKGLYDWNDLDHRLLDQANDQIIKIMVFGFTTRLFLPPDWAQLGDWSEGLHRAGHSPLGLQRRGILTSEKTFLIF